MTLVVTKRPQLIWFKSSSVVFRQIFNMKGRKKKIKNKCGQTLRIWLYQEFHLYFVASTNPPELLARDFLSLDAYGDAGKKLQCISRNRLQNEDKAPGKKQDSRGQATERGCSPKRCKITVVTLQMQREAVLAFGESCGVSQGSDREQQARGILCQRK